MYSYPAPWFNSQPPKKRASLPIDDSGIMRVLIVEDELRLARHIASALTEAGHNPTIVQDGETGIGEAQQTLYELIILDVMLPGRDGFEYCDDFALMESLRA